MFNYLFLVFILFLFSSCNSYVSVSSSAAQECAFRTDRGFIVRWEEFPISIYSHSSVSDLSYKNFLQAIDMWNMAWNYHTNSGPMFEFVGDINSPYLHKNGNQGDGISMVIVDTKKTFLDIRQQGTTHLRNFLGGGIIEGDIFINNVDYKYYYEPNEVDYSAYLNIPSLSTKRSIASTSPQNFWRQFIYVFQSALDFLFFWKSKNNREISSQPRKISRNHVDFLSLMIHELGHLSGLIHINEVNSIMNEELKKGIIRRTINELELQKVVCGYAL